MSVSLALDTRRSGSAAVNSQNTRKEYVDVSNSGLNRPDSYQKMSNGGKEEEHCEPERVKSQNMSNQLPELWHLLDSSSAG